MPARFLARATHEPRGHAVAALAAEDALHAAILFAERHPTAGDDGEIQIAVVDCETGAEQCFRIYLDDGSAEPC